ncbi:YfhO family protein [Tundrisphaera sp. TA3]|uniref:YfhO family protein n=1 Tax=Tundrisphaera sp. TA3 TaxID=3435775 RepID=UPI003EBEE70C
MSNDGEVVRSRTLLAVAASMALLMALPIALGKVYINDDIAYYSIPLRSFFAGCLANGTDPSWCPALFGGFSLYGEGGGFAHPLIHGLYGTLPLDLALNLDVIWPYPVMFVGFALLLARWGLRRDACLFGALVFTFGGQNLLQYIHTSVSSLLGHLPWALLSIDVALRSEDRRRAAAAKIALSLLTASQLLIGHVQFLWISMFGEGLYALFLAWRMPGSRRRVAGLGVSLGLGILAGSIQLLPSWEAFRESRRERPTLTYIATGSLPPANLLQSFSPYLTHSRAVTPPMATDEGVLEPPTSMYDWRVHAFSTYLGASIPVLLAWLIISRRSLAGSSRVLAAFALGLAAIGLLLAFGDFTPLFRLMVKVPVIGRFRISARYLILYQLAGAMLAALAYATLAEASARHQRIPWRRLWPLGLPLMLGLFLCLAPGLPEGMWPAYLRGEVVSPLPVRAIGPLLLAVAAVLVALSARGWRLALPLLVILTGIDQAAYAIHVTLLIPPESLSSYVDGRKSLPAPAEPGRVGFALLHPIWQDPFTMKGMSTMTGYVSLVPRRALTYDTPNSMRVAGVGWILEDATERGQSWAKAPAPPLPKARLVTRTQVSTDPKRDIETIDPGAIALTDRALNLPPAAPGQARIAHERPGKIDVRTEAPTRQLLVVSESFHDGWEAEIDGRPARLGRAYGDFLSCVVPKGAHRVLFRFHSEGRRVGAWLTLAGLILSVGVPLLPLIPRRGGPAPSSILLGMKAERSGRDADERGAALASHGEEERHG